VRGWVGIHAGKTFDKEGYVWVEKHFGRSRIEMPEAHLFEYGGIVGRARIVDCVDDHSSEWFRGRYGFVLANPEPLPFIPCRGQLGFFRPDLPTPSLETDTHG
jgi:hypothetical protein